MNPQAFQFLNPPVLSDENAAAILGFLYDLTTAFENHYATQLRRYHDPSAPYDPFDDEDEQPPPF